jgi:hypothetical protein
MSRRFGPEAELHPSRQKRWATRRYSITRGARCRRRDDRGRRVRGYRSRWKRRCETHTTAARHAALQTCGRSELAQAVWATRQPRAHLDRGGRLNGSRDRACVENDWNARLRQTLIINASPTWRARAQKRNRKNEIIVPSDEGLANFAGTLAASVHCPTTDRERSSTRKGRERTALRFSEMPRTVIRNLTAGRAILAHWRHI